MSDLTMYRGDDKDFVLTFADDAGDAIDITGWTVWLTVKRKKEDADGAAIFQKEVTSHTTPASGITTVTVDAADTSGVEPATYYYDIQRKDTSDKILTITSGQFVITRDITITTG